MLDERIERKIHDIRVVEKNTICNWLINSESLFFVLFISSALEQIQLIHGGWKMLFSFVLDARMNVKLVYE